MSIDPVNIRALEARLESLQIKVSEFEKNRESFERKIEAFEKKIYNFELEFGRFQKKKQLPECDVGCPGCSCHINPPCTHCVEHFKEE